MRTRQQVLQVSKVVGVYCRERLGGQMFGRRRGVVSVSVLLVIYILWVYCMERKKKSCIKFSNVFVKGCLNKFRKLIPPCVKCCTIT